MYKMLRVAIAAGFLALGLGAAPAQAAFIIGSISITDGLTGLPTAPSTSIVSALTGIQHAGAGGSFGCTGTFTVEASCGNSATMTDWLFAGPYGLIITIDGFSFSVSSVSSMTPTPLACSNGFCHDNLTLIFLGSVTGNGYLPSAFSGQLSFSDSCQGAGTTCTDNITAGYTYSLTATGAPRQVPEPATLALLGLGLAGLGFLRRRQS